ncbi:unnamed protein product [uncultured bacterium]|nr:unnamed protein product [uncultured bacterium]
MDQSGGACSRERAGLARLQPISKRPLQDSLPQIALNITAVTRLTHAVLPAFLSRDDGLIMNVASVLTIKALPISSVYSGTKAFVLNFSRGLQDELAEDRFRVQVVLPASTATEIWNDSGIPLLALNEKTVMTAENLADGKGTLGTISLVLRDKLLPRL